MTLRQLRQMASDLGVTLYSRKSKEDLVSAIAERQERRGGDLKAIEAELTPPSQSQSTTRVVFLPRDPQWAYVFWEISDTDRRRAQSEGAAHLSLRLADVTGLQNGSAHPHTLQEVPVDSHSTEWYLPVPLCDRDYRVELGFRSGSNWISLAFSSVARVPALHPSDQILDQFVPFSLEAAAPAPAPVAPPAEPSDSGLHERLYQSATTHFRSRRVGSEVLHEQDSMAGDQRGLSDSGAGLWASGRNESGLGGVAPRQRTF